MLLCLHGHGEFGHDAVAGIDHTPERAANIKKANYDYARQLAREGFITVAPCMRPFGRRLDAGSRKGRTDPCAVTFVRLMLLGQTLMGANLLDCKWALDFAATLPGVDIDRCGCVGLSYGGRMTMLVDPIRSSEELGYYETFAGVLAEGRGCTEAVVLDEEKSGGGRPTDRFLFDDAGAQVACRAVGDAPAGVTDSLQSLSVRRRPYVAAGTSYMPQLKRCRLLIVGAGHVGQDVARLAESVGFDVWVVDDRAEYCNPERFPEARRLMVAPIDSALSGLEIDTNTFCVIVTRGHNHDEEALYHLVETPAAYVGMIGSRRKIKLIFEDLLGEGISRESLARVRAPLGFEIGSQSVPEIAVSIVAELVAVRNLEEFPEAYRQPSLVEELKASTE